MSSRSRHGAFVMSHGMNTMDNGERNSRSSEASTSFNVQQPLKYNFHRRRPPHKKQKISPTKKGELLQSQMKGLSCSACKRFYDLKSNCPLLLKCCHSVCEDCLLDGVKNDRVSFSCRECNLKTQVPIVPSVDFSIRDYFPINYCMAGKVYFAREASNSAAAMDSRFVQDQTNILNCEQEACTSLSSVFSIDNQKCDVCSNIAAVRCAECSSNLCEACSSQAHGDAASDEMKKHSISTFVIKKCSEHDVPNDFYCSSCNENFCSYCILNAHTNHSFKQVTKVQHKDLEEFKALLDICKTVLGKLERTNEIVNRRIATTPSKAIKPEFARKLLNDFRYLHSKLQQLERRAIAQATSASNLELHTLFRIGNALKCDIKALQKLIANAEGVLKKQSNARHNIDVIMHRMSQAKGLPHHLRYSETSNNETEIELDFTKIVADLDRALILNIPESDTYKLTTEEGVDEKKSMYEVTIGEGAKTSVHIQRGGQDLLTDGSGSFEDIAISETPIQFERNQAEIVRLLHFVTPRKFYVFPLRLTNDFATFNATIQDEMKNDVSLDKAEKPSPLQMYFVKYHKEPIWRRGIVCSANMESSECEVNLLDYGLTAVISFDSLYEIPKYLVTTPPFAKECRLYDVDEPEGRPWTDNVATDIVYMVNESNIALNVIRVLPEKIYECDLKVFAKHQDFSLREVLIATGCVVPLGASEPSVEISLIPQVQEGLVFRNNIMNLNESVNVRLVRVLNATTVFVQTCSLHDVEHLQLSLNDYYNKHADKCEIYIPVVNMAVAVKMSFANSFGNWHRAVITSVNQHGRSVKIFMVDYGFETFINCLYIWKLDPKFLDVPKMAAKVNLIDVSYKNEVQNKMGMNLLTKLKNTPLKMTVLDFKKLPQVTLYEEQDNYNRCVNAHLVSIGLKSSGAASLTLLWPKNNEDRCERKSRDPSSMSLLSQIRVNSEPDVTENEEDLIGIRLDKVRVLNVQDPHSIYVHLVENKNLMMIHSNISSNLQQYYQIHPLVTHSEWTENEAAIAFNENTRQYYRVIIVMKKSEDLYEVRGLDYANIFTVRLHNIGECAQEFASYSPTALKVRLYGTSPFGPNWSLTATDFVNDLIFDNSNTYITKLKDDEFNPYPTSDAVPILMWLKEMESAKALQKRKVQTLCVNKVLCLNGLGKLAKDFALPKPIISLEEADSSGTKATHEKQKSKWLPALPLSAQLLQGIVTYIEQDGTIFFNEISDCSEVKMIESKLAKHFAAFNPDASVDWKIGDICTVRYHRNGKWYRGEVVGIELGPSPEYHVRMIDYGNIEQVLYDEISPKVFFLDRPILKKAIRLYNLNTADGGVTQEVIDSLHAFLVDKVIDIHCTKCIEENDFCPEATVYAGRENVSLFLHKQFDCVLTIPSTHAQDDSTFVELPYIEI